MREHNRTLLDKYENTQGVFELRRLIEDYGIYAIKFMKFHLIFGLFESRSGLNF